jgi:hypothetical protein
VRRLRQHAQVESAGDRVNEKYVAREGRVGFYALYHSHDRHFAIAVARADIPIRSSCYCRMIDHAAVA